MSLSDKLLLRRQAIIEAVIDQLKHISQIEHSRHRSVVNCKRELSLRLDCLLPPAQEAFSAHQYCFACFCLTRTDVSYRFAHLRGSHPAVLIDGAPSFTNLRIIAPSAMQQIEVMPQAGDRCLY